MKIIAKIIVILICIFILKENAYSLPSNPGPTGIPVFLGDPSNTGTYTGTINNPIKTSIKDGTITTIENPVWEAQPITKCYYSVSNIPATQSITINYIPDTSTTTHSQYIEYFLIIKDNIDVMGYCSFIIKNGSLVFLAGEITPSSPQSIFKLPIPIKIDALHNIELTITNKEAEPQSFKSSLIYSMRKN